MAVNLRATAHLNIKPYMKGIADIAAATKKLNATAVGAASKGETPLMKQVDAIKKSSRAATVAADNMAAGTRRASTAFSTINRSAASYKESLDGISRSSDANIKRMGTMTAKQIALETSTNNLRNARKRLADVMSVDRVAGDPVLAAAEKNLRAQEAAYTRSLRARRAEVHAAIDQREAERQLTKARDTGANSARQYRSSIAGLNAEQLRAKQLTNNLAVAEANLARQIASSQGVRSPKVLAAENALLGAQGAIQADNAVGMSAATNSMTAQRHALRDLSRQIAMGAGVMAALPALSIGVAASWESSFSSVVRTADPAFSEVESKVRGLRSSLVSLAQTMPIGFGQVTEIATLANQMGIASGEVANFTQAVAMFSATSGVSVDISATAFGRLTSILGDNSIAYMEMADSILKVGVNSVATEEEIINVTTQISSIAAQAGFAGKDIIGLSGALASVRVPPELSRGLITRVFGTIDKAVAGNGAALANLARVSGMTVEQFKEGWGSDGAAGVFTQFLEGLRKGGSAARGELEALGITSVRDVPVLLRLANAADSNGVVGGLLTQTLADANNAAGETQRQYSIMAETVVSKLKMLGNNLLAFFDAVGQSGLGVFGDVLDNMTSGIRSFTRDLDKPMKLLGTFELPWTNSEALGLAMSLGAIASGMMLIGSAAAKIGSAFLVSRQIGTWLGVFGGVSNTARTVSSGLGTAAVSATSFGTAAAGAVGGTNKFVGGLRSMWTALGGWWGVAIIAAIALMGTLSSAMRDARTDSDAFSETLSSVDLTSINNVNAALGKIQTGASLFDPYLGTDIGTPFKDGIKGLNEYLDLDKSIEANTSGFLESLNINNGLTKLAGDYVKGIARTFPSLASGREAVETLDESIGKLVSSGNSAKAMQLITKLGKSGVDLVALLSDDKAKETKDFLQNAFDLAGLEMTDANLHKFAKGTLPQVSDALAGFSGATRVAMDLFDGDLDAVGTFTEALASATASFIDFGAAASAAFNVDTGEFNLTNYISALQEQLTNQANWTANMETVADYVSVPLLEKLSSDTSDAGIAAMAALAEGLRNGSPEAIQAIEQLEANLAASLASGEGTAIRMAFREWASSIMGDEGLGRELAQALSEAEYSQLQTAAEGVGKDTVARVLKGIQSGSLTFEDGLTALRMDLPLEPVIELDEEAAARSMAALNATLKKRDTGEFRVPMNIDTTTTVSQLKSIIDNPALNKLNIDGNLTLTEAYAQSREFQVWAELQGIDFMLGADDARARLSLAAMIAVANESVAEVTITALPEPAENAVWEIVTLANGQTGFIQINGDNTLAKESVWAVDEATGVPAEMLITGDNVEAINKVLAVRGSAATTPATININGDDTNVKNAISRNTGFQGTAFINIEGRGVVNASTALNHAQGGIIEAYANGGVREDHRPQIAPAGAMRLWAEPETGGEAYIPFAMDRRKRAEGILNDVAGRFGYSLVKGSNVAQFVNGGQYMAQAMARSQRSYAVQGSASSRGVSIGEVTFTDSTQKDQFREFTRTLNRVARGNR